MEETIKWFNANEEVPASTKSVLIVVTNPHCVGVGYYDDRYFDPSMCWRFVNGIQARQVIYWAEMPDGPGQ